jgi:hypothetical protein
VNLDPLPAGILSADSVDFYPDEARASDTPVNVAVVHTADAWVVDTATVPPGRWYPRVRAQNDAGATTYDLPYLDLPDDPTLVVSPEALAARIRMPLPLDEDTREVIEDSIRDAQADVEAYLGQPVVPTEFVQQHCWPYPGGWMLTVHDDAFFIGVVSVAAEYDTDGVTATGYFTVTYTAGLDAKNDPSLRPIRRFIMAAAANSEDVTLLWRTATGSKGAIKSVSAEGQSVSFDPAYPLGAPPPSGRGSGAKPVEARQPGELPTFGWLDRWRVAGRRVYQGATRYGALDGLR